MKRGWKNFWGRAAVVMALAMLGSCERPAKDRVQGYVEGEYVYVASPLAGQLMTLSVARGDLVKAGEPLFALDQTSETAARDEAQRRLAQSRANLEDAKKGKRPTEIQSMQAQLDQARAALDYAEKDFARTETLMQNGGRSRDDYDRAKSALDGDRKRVTELEADLQTAQLGQRADQIAAAEADVRARQAALEQAEWNLSQKHQEAPQEGVVFDTLYRQGEWVAAGRPVVALLPPENIKVRAFVSETRVGTLHVGESLSVAVDGVAGTFAGKISFISPKAEFTPPVIYSEESRSKLVFMIEIVFLPADAGKLHPGQPVDVLLAP